jgi:hypothetical protein
MVDSQLNLVHKTSAEKVALDLLERVAFIEWKRIGRDQEYRTATDREWLLNTYAECLEAAKGRRIRKTSDGPAGRQELSVSSGARNRSTQDMGEPCERAR